MQFVKVVINFTWYCLELWLCRILNLSSQKVILCGNSLHRELKAGPLQWANNSIGLVPETDRLHRRKSLWRQSGEIVRCLQWGAWRSSKDHTHTQKKNRRWWVSLLRAIRERVPLPRPWFLRTVLSLWGCEILNIALPDFIFGLLILQIQESHTRTLENTWAHKP